MQWVGGESELGTSRAFEEVRSEGPGDGGREHGDQVSRANHREELAWLLLGRRLQASGRLAGRMELGVLQWSFHSCGNNRAMRGRQGEYARFRCNHVPHECRRLNHLAQNRPDIAFAANFLARSMAHPRVGDQVRMKRVIRYLKAHRRCRLNFCLPGDAQAGNSVERQRLGWKDQATRRSTSGVMISHGAHLLLIASRLQKTVALSFGEAELNAQVTGMSEGLGVSGVCEEWCLGSELACFCDSSAARGIASRAGGRQNETS